MVSSNMSTDLTSHPGVVRNYTQQQIQLRSQLSTYIVNKLSKDFSSLRI